MFSRPKNLPKTLEEELARVRDFQAHLESGNLRSRLEEKGVSLRFSAPTVDSSAYPGAAAEEDFDDAASEDGAPSDVVPALAPNSAKLTTTDINKITPTTLLRFLRARTFNFAQAAKLLEKNLLWRGTVQPNNITPEDIATPLESGVWTFLGLSKHNRPVLLINAGMWKPEHYGIETYVKFVAFFLNQAERQIEDLAEGPGTAGSIFYPECHFCPRVVSSLGISVSRYRVYRYLRMANVFSLSIISLAVARSSSSAPLL